MNLMSSIEPEHLASEISSARSAAASPIGRKINPLDLSLEPTHAIIARLVAGEREDLIGAIALGHIAGGGRRVRARLALAATHVLGGSAERAAGWAAACELLHNASLVHDDLQDGDRLRRGRATVWSVYGMPQAVNAGDLMLMLAYRAIEFAEVDDATRWRLSRLLARSAEATVRGQALELECLGGVRTDTASYRAVIDGKTAALFAMPVAGGAIIAGRVDEADTLAQPFALLGAMYQLQDDVIDLYGDKGRDARGCDLREGKVSALVVEHLRLCPDDRDRLVEILQRPRTLTTSADIQWASERFIRSGALSAVIDQIHQRAYEVATHPALAPHSDLQQVANALANLVLEPLRGITIR